ncbi:DUF2339 domain-containing protein [Longimicrobium sp.]|jgi:uncharacterized membrane protein|uniref:DUF2339 domain-containing protein n=1 Tax=Longimicrobium sp. TaxID=2029185 RepID=UPI002F949D1A
MTTLPDDSLEQRLARLERMVEELHRRLPPVRDGGVEAVRPPLQAEARPIPAIAESADLDGWGTRGPRTAPRRPSPDLGLAALFPWDGQTWLNRLGIVLLLLGVGLLFRYSIDQGWVTPQVRVGFGAAVGAVLSGLGLRIDQRRRFAPVLLGGGAATFYITGWAAYYLYSLVPYTAAFGAMVAITLAAFGLALSRGQPALAVLGAGGGLGVPLLLGISLASPRGLAAYTSFILAWTVVPYLRRGWRSSLWTSMALAWTLLALYANLLAETFRAGAEGRGWIQAAVAFAWIVLGVLPIARRVADWRAAEHGGHGRWSGRDVLHWYGIALVPPAMALAVSGITWRMSAERWGAAAIALAAGYLLAAWALRAKDARIAKVLLFAVAVLLPAGCLGALEGEALLVSLALQGLGFHMLARRGAGVAVRWMAHKLMLAAGAWLAWRIAFPGATGPWRLAADAVVVGATFAAAGWIRVPSEAMAYRIAAQMGAMALVVREVAHLPGGQGIATIAWGVYGLGLLVYALRRGSRVLERLAILTLLAAVAKLFLVDLARLDALFRVLLFLGFGSVFLWLSYSLSGWWDASAEARARPAGRDA